jgi:hypothetical protein
LPCRRQPAAHPLAGYRGGADGVTVDGDADLIAQLRRLLTAVTNTG